MSFVEAVKTCFQKYVTFKGRARRSEFWWFMLFNSVVSGILSSLSQYGTFFMVLFVLAYLAMILPCLAVLIRRLQDMGKRWPAIFISLIPIVGAILLIVWCAKDSEPGTNAFGPNPKEAAPQA